MPHILIFEPDPRGHTFEWLAYLLRYAAKEASGQQVTFAVARELADRLTALPDVGHSSQVKIVALDISESRLCLSNSLVVSGFARWWVMRRHLKREGADHGFFLCLDHLSLPLALGLRAAGRSLSGILFRPSTHYAALTNLAPTRGEHLRDLRKRVLYALSLRNPALRRVLSLDPYFVGMQHGGKIEALADPAFAISGESEALPVAPGGRTRFLLFGALTERKGILALYDALMRVPPAIAQKSAVMIAGKIDPALWPALKIRMATLAHAQPDLLIEQRDRFIPDDELNALIASSDIVLAPYQRFVGSSGVMLRAALAGKPVLTQSYGLLGKLTRDFALGVTVDTADPDRLAEVFTSLVQNGAEESFDPKGAATFLAAHSPLDFATAVFDRSTWEAVQHKRRLGNFTSAPRTGHASPLSRSQSRARHCGTRDAQNL